MTSDMASSTNQHTCLPIEIGIIMIGRFDAVDQQAIQLACDAFKRSLQQQFLAFSWHTSLVIREDIAASIRHEPSALLEDGSQIREARKWDFAFVMTSADLKARYRPYALAALSSALASAVISTSRIDPQSYQSGFADSERQEILAHRLQALLTHAFGHLNGLVYKQSERDLIPGLQGIESNTKQQVFSAGQSEVMLTNLYQIADERLEEQEQTKYTPLLQFYLLSSWINRHEIINAVRQARPWEFPARLVRLSAAALSAMLVLLLTAEVWHLALVQTLPKTVFLLLTTLLLTTVFVTLRQRLLVQRTLHQRTEQSVITNMSAGIIVLSGMLTTTLLLMTISMLFSWLLHTPELIMAWSDSAIHELAPHHYLQTNVFVTTLGLLIGALGASFEEQYYFRHIVFVDAEI